MCVCVYVYINPLLVISFLQRQSRKVSRLGSHGNHHNPTEDDDYNFNFGPQDFDVDAEILSPDAEEDTTFVLRPKDAQLAGKKKQAGGIKSSASRDGRLMMLNMDTQQSKELPRLASPAAEGWGPTVAMPTLVGMGQTLDQSMEESGDLDSSVFSMRALSIIEGMQGWDPSILPTTPTSPSSPTSPSAEGKEMPASIAKIFPKLPRATVAGTEEQQRQQEQQKTQPATKQEREPQAPTQPGSNKKEREGGVGGGGGGKDKTPKPDLTSYQFPVDPEEVNSSPLPPPPPSTPPPSSKPRQPSPPLSRKLPGSALKKTALVSN